MLSIMQVLVLTVHSVCNVFVHIESAGASTESVINTSI